MADEEITGECLYFLELISISGVCLGDTSYWMYIHISHISHYMIVTNWYLILHGSSKPTKAAVITLEAKLLRL